MFFKPAAWESKTYKEKGIENKKKQSRELNKMPKIKMNFRDAKILLSWKKNKMLWKETGFRKSKQKPKNKLVKWLYDEVGEIIYKEQKKN